MLQEQIEKQVYTVISVEKTDSPEGLEGDNWHRYILGCGDSTIEGLKPGSLHDVTEHAENVAKDLNERKDSRGSTYAPRSRQRARK